MTKKIIFLLLTVATLNTYAKTASASNVDPFVENKFKKEFGSSLNVSWEVIHDMYVATFIEKGERKQVYYNSDGEIWAFGKPLSKEQLPETAARLIKERFASGFIVSVYELQTDSSPTRYIVRLITNRHQLIVSSNEFGRVEILQKKKIKKNS
jgi:hypothetical protein